MNTGFLISKFNSPSFGFHSIKDKFRLLFTVDDDDSALLPILCQWIGLMDIMGDPMNNGTRDL